ncbi:uncharacterized protein B0P05DRAFT_323588 [Gilbertella persicaria]|uniref:uncharacterized protein n=1 Tax=Gilbertella persicaria TaxID=101096 RepID=UPI00221F6B26|nr:uncharacterized protein B0P05DRAFT_323588 [Gilbertella persicaria]KAI8090098.1 hypothetical protein B0P05DRAFT_323588 [Gilbertella persicaria]
MNHSILIDKGCFIIENISYLFEFHNLMHGYDKTKDYCNFIVFCRELFNDHNTLNRKESTIRIFYYICLCVCMCGEEKKGMCFNLIVLKQV